MVEDSKLHQLVSEMEDLHFLSTFLDEAESMCLELEDALLSLDKESTKIKIEEVFRIAHTLKGSSKAVKLIQFSKFLHKCEDILSDLVEKDGKWTSELSDLFLDAQEFIGKWLNSLRDDPNYQADTSSFDRVIDSILQSDNKGTEAAYIKDAHKQGFAYFAPPKKSKQQNPPPDKKPDIEKSDRISKPSASNQNEKKAKIDYIRVNKEKVNKIIRTLSEVTIQFSYIYQMHKEEKYSDEAFINTMNEMKKFIFEVHSSACSLKEESLGLLKQRLHRIAKDASRATKKEVDFSFEGEDLELNKSLTDRILDPLVHIIRNSVDHGIESSELRKSKKKPVKGQIKFKASKDAHGVHFSISDDGGGLNLKKIKEKAIEKGLIDENQALDKKEVCNLILKPGFSTASQLTEISGRGVGMDVVNTSIRELGGVVGISSEEGVGTTIDISLPSDMSILDSLVIESFGTKYVVPIGSVSEIIDIKDFDIRSSAGVGEMICKEKKVIPIKPMSEFLVHQKPANAATEGARVGLLLDGKGRQFVMKVDRLCGTQSTIIMPLLGGFNQIKEASGFTILKNGEPALVLNTKFLCEKFEQMVN